NQGVARVKVQVLSNESRQIAEIAKSGRSTRGVEVAMNQADYQPISHSRPTQNAQRTAPAPLTRRPVTAQNAVITPVEVADIETNVPGHITRGKFYPDPIVEQRPVSTTSIFVQVASFADSARAQNYAGTLQDFGKTQIQPAIVQGRNYYRVRIGPLANVPEADRVLARLASNGQNDAIVVVD
ncbi:MAG: SPOR domain-containing protein, partial [Pseudomonadota bacterium]